MSFIRKNFVYLLFIGIIGLIRGFDTTQAHIPPVPGFNLSMVLSDPDSSNKSQKDADTQSDTSNQSQKERKLKTLIEGEAKQQGLLTGIMSGVVFLYSSISDLLLHPVLTIVISVLTLGLLALGAIMIVLFRREDFSTLGKLVSVAVTYCLLYIDLLFIMYEQRKVTMAFFMLDKDILLVVLAAVVGYFVGRSSSRQVFEEKVLP